LDGSSLGAAGIVEASIGLLSMSYSHIPENLNLTKRDAGMGIALVETPIDKPVNRILSNSFGFGGSNCSLIVGRVS
jgi:3-oxoacyl-[acyl-carrier-protein] synthase I